MSCSLQATVATSSQTLLNDFLVPSQLLAAIFNGKEMWSGIVEKLVTAQIVLQAQTGLKLFPSRLSWDICCFCSFSLSFEIFINGWLLHLWLLAYFKSLEPLKHYVWCKHTHGMLNPWIQVYSGNYTFRNSFTFYQILIAIVSSTFLYILLIAASWSGLGMRLNRISYVCNPTIGGFPTWCSTLKSITITYVLLKRRFTHS